MIMSASQKRSYVRYSRKQLQLIWSLTLQPPSAACLRLPPRHPSSPPVNFFNRLLGVVDMTQSLFRYMSRLLVQVFFVFFLFFVFFVFLVWLEVRPSCEGFLQTSNASAKVNVSKSLPRPAFHPLWAILDTEISVLSAESPQLSKIFFLFSLAWIRI